MGFIILGLLAIVEMALFVVTVTKQKGKEEWLRNRLIAGVGEAALFLIAILLPPAAWDFRFKICFYVLVIRAMMAFICYTIKHKKVSGRKSKVGAMASTVGGIMILAFALIPAFLFTGYEGLGTSGTYKVKEVSAILVDENRVETFETDGTKREVPGYSSRVYKLASSK